MKEIISNIESIFDACDKESRRSLNDDKTYYVCKEDIECPYKSDELTLITLFDYNEDTYMERKIYNLPVCYYKNVDRTK